MADRERRSGKGISSDRDERKRRKQSEERSPRRHRERDRSRSPTGRHPHSRREDHHDGRDRGRREERSSKREEDEPRRRREERSSKREEDEHRRRREDRHRRDDSRDHHDDRGYGRDQSNMDQKGKEVHHNERGSPHRPWIDKKEPEAKEPAIKKAEPDFSVSGKLAAETNTLNGVLIKYAEPPEARIPKTRWRFYQFKGDDLQNTLYLHRQSAFLIGRDRKVYYKIDKKTLKIVDFPIDHPSCSKQHAVLQYRLADYKKADGRNGKKVKPYVLDLESTNGTYVNNNRIDPRRYFELKEKDMVKFGFSSREYVLLHENSQESEDEGDPIGDSVPET